MSCCGDEKCEKVKKDFSNNGYWNIHGRFSRMQYFLHWLGLVGIGLLSIAVLTLSGISIPALSHGAVYGTIPMIGIVISLFLLLTMTIGGFTIMVKRFHDFNQSGWFVLLITVLIWIVGMVFPPGALLINIVLTLILFFMRGTYGKNNYGEDPVKIKSTSN